MPHNLKGKLGFNQQVSLKTKQEYLFIPHCLNTVNIREGNRWRLGKLWLSNSLTYCMLSKWSDHFCTQRNSIINISNMQWLWALLGRSEVTVRKPYDLSFSKSWVRRFFLACLSVAVSSLVFPISLICNFEAHFTTSSDLRLNPIRQNIFSVHSKWVSCWAAPLAVYKLK